MARSIVVKGAREHNLKNVSLTLPKDQLVVITGPSGSGKSSLAFDTLFAEGQRRYMESLSAYARQFMGMLKRPDVDEIDGLSPTISIEQKGISHNPRSTVGTVTEVYDYLRLLFARAGTPLCPECGKPVRRWSLDEIVDVALTKGAGGRLEVLAPMATHQKGEFKNLFASLRKEGYLRVRVDGEILWLEEEIPLEKNKHHTIEVVVDRVRAEEERRGRIAEAVQGALELSKGFVTLVTEEGEVQLTEHYGCPDCHVTLPPLEPALFSFNNHMGACPDCSGLGCHTHFSPELAINPTLSVHGGALLPLRGRSGLMNKLEVLSRLEGIDLDIPFAQLRSQHQEMIWKGSDRSLPLTFTMKGEGTRHYQGRYEGLEQWLKDCLESNASDEWKEEFYRYQQEVVCPSCGGTRLRPEARSVVFGGKTLPELTTMPIDEVYPWVKEILKGEVPELVTTVLGEVHSRLGFLVDVGAGYLSLNRRSDTLSGGESQRIRLASQIGSKLSGVMYVLDEPTIGLHSRDTDRLVKTLERVRDLGNTVIVVEHDRDTIAAADYIVEVGPKSGEEGGEIVASGTLAQVKRTKALTGPYLRGQATGITPSGRAFRPSTYLSLRGAAEHNLKNLDLDLPTGGLVCLTGVSGSGKSTLLHQILYRGVSRALDSDFRQVPGAFKSLKGADQFKNVALVDQSPIGRTPRSNPATYTGLFTPIRELFATLPEARLRGYNAGRFSFNTKGGRCEACHGAGETRVSMLFLPDVHVPCEVCGGTRYNRETLEVKYKDHSIADVLNLTIDQASKLFDAQPAILRKLETLQEAGLGYMKLGQSSLTLSGGEAQRVKLAKELSKRFSGPTLYLLDEPSTGLYYNDVAKLLHIMHRLVDQGNSLVVIEHNLDILLSADWIVDLGPEGGSGGGQLVFSGTPRDCVEKGTGHTAEALRAYIEDLGGWPHEKKRISSTSRGTQKTKAPARRKSPARTTRAKKN